LVDFTSEVGVPLQAVLQYPVNYVEGETYPMIVYTYELLSQGLHRYITPSERSYYNYQVWTQQGYFVLQPDIVYRPRDPGVSAVEAVVPAVARVVEMGMVDADRVGLIGHSWGGYQATYIPTRTDIFATSVAGAPLTNFLSMVGSLHWNPGMPELGHWETGQARMDVPPWEDFEAHVRNSPAAFIQDLETPMLMMHGSEDGVVDFGQGVEFYNYARRAGKEFVFLVYPGADHGLRDESNQVDYHRRILQWFGHYLKGDDAPTWMTEGVRWLDREKEIGG
jgi:dipeptidyl aminopeptidase/acylaminoacyl peptidase